jgi:RimJ/RimL family protein N-acetyltransferase
MLAPPDPPLSAGEILLRPFEESDLAAIVVACQDPEIPRWTRVPSPYTADDARAYLEAAARGWAEGTDATFAVVERETGVLLAAVGVHDLGAVAEVGYWVTSAARGRGVATTAVSLVSRWALGMAGVARLELLAHPENGASQRVAEKAGFTREGLLCAYLEIKGERRDCVMFSLLATDQP